MERTIVWALDAFEPPGDILQAAIRTLSVLGPQLQARIRPVFILNPWQMNLATEFGELAEMPGMELYRSAAEASLHERLKDIALPGLLEPVVITVDSASTHQSIEALSNYAELTDAEVILVSSHARSGLGRFFLGSFSEKLILFSQRPVVVVHGSPAISQSDSSRVLVATDLTDGGKVEYGASLELGKKMGLEIILFHSVPHPLEEVFQSGVFLLSGGWMPTHEYVTSEIESRQKKLDAWVAEGKNRGLAVRGVLDTGGGSVALAIIRTARQEKAGLIAMSANTGPIATVFLGSVTREVVRASECPVWVFRTGARQQTKNQDEAVA
jgi:nucleotide-binding universal stress UspA family protein